MEKFLKMTGYEFEEFISTLLKNRGFQVEVTSFSNDGGIDIIATYDKPIFSGKYIIQCKNWQNSVGQPEVRDLYGVVMDQRANKGILITPNGYTAQAYEFAKGKNLELISGEILKKMIEENDIINEDVEVKKGDYLYKDDRYYYLKKHIEEEPNVAQNYIELINYMRDFYIKGKMELCSDEMLDELIVIINDMISRCFRGVSHAAYKQCGLLLNVEVLMVKGELAKATELLIKMDKFFIGKYSLHHRIAISRLNEGVRGWYSSDIYAWNLYSAFKNIGYNKGAELITSNAEHIGYTKGNNPLDIYKENLEGNIFVFPHVKMISIGRRVDYFDVSIFFEDEIGCKDYVFERCKKKPYAEYERELDLVLKLNGLI